jgi:glycosyltransferase involved in cell wall biosynthesis
VEHVVQDAGSPGIEGFAREVGAEFYRDGRLEFSGTRNTERYRLVIYSERDEGMYDAVNRGILKTKGDFVAYLNCDEQYLEGALGSVVDFFVSNPKAQILCGGVYVVGTDFRLITARPGITPWLGHVASDHLPIFTAALFYRREVVANRWNLFDLRYKDLADSLWVQERIRERRRFVGLPFATSVFVDTGANMNLMPNARAEAKYLKGLVPWYYRLLKPLYRLAHRFRKLFLGCYQKRRYVYEVYTFESLGERERFEEYGNYGIWHDRLKF